MTKPARIYDQDLIKRIMDHPKNIGAISPDRKKGEDWPINDLIIYLGMFTDDIIGLFIGFPRSDIVLDVHVAMHPEHYSETDHCYELAIKWVEQNTDYKKLTGQTPSFNRLAIKCNERNGFKVEGINRKSFLRNGRLYDQIYFGRCLNGS